MPASAKRRAHMAAVTPPAQDGHLTGFVGGQPRVLGGDCIDGGPQRRLDGVFDHENNFLSGN